jgi:hypothetical protein
LTIGCQSSFQLGPTEVPQLAQKFVRTPDGRTEPVPEKWTANIVPRDGDGAWRLMTPEKGAVVRAFPVPAQHVERAEREGWTDKPIVFESPFVGDLVHAPAPGAPYGRVLRVQDVRGRTVDVPVESIDHVEVENADKSGRIIGIVAGSVGGAVLLGVLAVVVITNVPFAH